MKRVIRLTTLIGSTAAAVAFAGTKFPPAEPPTEMLMAAERPAISETDRAANVMKAAETLARAGKDDALKAAAYMEASRYFEAAGEYRKAATWAVEASKKIRNGAEAGAALLRAGQMWERAGEFKKGAKVFERLYKTDAYKDHPFAFGGETITLGEAAALQAGVCRELIGDYKGAARNYGDYVTAYKARPAPIIWAHYRRGRALAAGGKDADARDAFQKALDVVRSFAGNPAYDLSPALDAAAGAEFYRAEYDYREFVSLKLELPQERMERNLREMLTISQKLVGAYNDVAAAGVPAWEVAARCRLGDTYGAFAVALAAAEIPKEINPKSWRHKKTGDPARTSGENGYNAYKDALDKQLQPLRRNAFDSYKGALKAAAGAGIDGEWSRRAREEHERLGKEFGFVDAPAPMEVPPETEMGHNGKD